MMRISHAVLFMLYLFSGIGPEFLHHHHGIALSSGSEALASHECRDHEKHAPLRDGVLCPFCLRAIEPCIDRVIVSDQREFAECEILPFEQTELPARLDYTNASKRGPPTLS